MHNSVLIHIKDEERPLIDDRFKAICAYSV